MPQDLVTPASEDSNRAFSFITRETYRRVLSVLIDGETPMSQSQLVSELCDHQPATSTDESNRGRLRIELAHKVLPKLEAAGLIEPVSGGLSTADHPLYSDPVARRILAEDFRDDVLRALDDQRRRHVIAVLSHREGPIHRRALAAAVATRERDGGDVSTSTVDDVLVTLHHVHCPLLDDCGLVEYDGETVEFVDHADVDPDTRVRYDGETLSYSFS